MENLKTCFSKKIQGEFHRIQELHKEILEYMFANKSKLSTFVQSHVHQTFPYLLTDLSLCFHNFQLLNRKSLKVVTQTCPSRVLESDLLCKHGNFEVGWSWLYPDAPRWHIYLHKWLKAMMNVGHFPYMEHLGYKGLLIRSIIPVEKRTILDGNTFIFEGPCFPPNHDYGRKSISSIVHVNFLSSNSGKASILFLIGSV